jgi:hypothetical protein
LTKKTQSLATFVSHFLLTKEKLSPHNPMTTTTTTTTTRRSFNHQAVDFLTPRPALQQQQKDS